MINLQQYHLEQYLVRRAPRRCRPSICAGRTRWSASRRWTTARWCRWKRPTAATACDADWLVVADGARSHDAPRAGPGHRRPGVQGPLSDRRRGDEGRLPGRALVLVRPAVPPQPERVAAQARPTTSGASTSSSAGTPTRKRKRSPKTCCRASTPCWATTREFELEWVSVYTFQCRRMKNFRHGRVLFAGDAAHQVSPFGARGANSGFQDTDNLVWKLALVIEGRGARRAAGQLRQPTASARPTKTCCNSTRSTDFITPKSAVSRDFRNAVLTLARQHAFARALVNSGRLSVPAHLLDSGLNTADAEPFAGAHATRRAAGRCTGAARRPRQLAAAPHRARFCAAAVRRFACSAGRADAPMHRQPDARADRRAHAAGERNARPRRPPAPRWWSTSKASCATASTAATAPPTCCAPTSMWPRVGAAWIWRPCRRRWHARPAPAIDHL